MEKLHRRADGFSELPSGELAVVMLKRTRKVDNHNIFRYVPKPYAEPVELTWGVDQRVFAVDKDIATFMISMGWARVPNDEDIAWWNDLIDQIAAAADAATLLQEPAQEPAGEQQPADAPKVAEGIENGLEAVENGANGTANAPADAADTGTSDGTEEAVEETAEETVTETATEDSVVDEAKETVDEEVVEEAAPKKKASKKSEGLL